MFALPLAGLSAFDILAFNRDIGTHKDCMGNDKSSYKSDARTAEDKVLHMPGFHDPANISPSTDDRKRASPCHICAVCALFGQSELQLSRAFARGCPSS